MFEPDKFFFDLLFLVAQGFIILFEFLQLSSQLIDLVIEFFVLLGQIQDHLLAGPRISIFFGIFFYQVLIVLSSVLTEFVNDPRNNSHQLRLNGMIHVENKRDVFPSVVSFDGYPQQEFPNVHRVLIDVQTVKVLFNIGANLFPEVLLYFRED